MKQLTVFTTTYNRDNLLPSLYDSLCRQTSSDFKWLIVDDGSTDNTGQLVFDWIEQGVQKQNITIKKMAVCIPGTMRLMV